MRTRGSSVAGNPVLIGAATILVVLVAVFLAYNANQGLPFVPTYDLRLNVPTAANLVRGNDVRIGGARVGAVDALEAKRQPDGSTYAQVSLKLDRTVMPLPEDSTVIIRPKSVLGLKYVEITRGRSEQGFDDGATIPLSASQVAQVEFDEVADTFDAPTREAGAQSIDEFGTALAGRGQSINRAIGAFRPLLRDLVPVMQNLGDPSTGLERFVRELGEAAAIVAPAAETQAQLFVGLNRTFAALAGVRSEIQETIDEGPATLDTAVDSFRVQRPFLANSAALMRELRPGVASLRRAAPDLSDALVVGTPTLERTPGFNRRLLSLVESVQDFGEDPIVPRGVMRLRDTLAEVQPTLDFVAPAQTVCNYAALWFRNVASLLSEGDSTGTWQRFIIISPPTGPNNEGGPASAPASGPGDNYLHTNPYPNTAAPGQPRECEAGHEPFASGQVVTSNPPGTQPARTEGNP